MDAQLLMTIVGWVLSIIAIAFAGATFARAGKWHNDDQTRANTKEITTLLGDYKTLSGRVDRLESNDHTKENTEKFATILEKLNTIENAVGVIPEMRDRIVAAEHKIALDEKRISNLEQRRERS